MRVDVLGFGRNVLEFRILIPHCSGVNADVPRGPQPPSKLMAVTGVGTLIGSVSPARVDPCRGFSHLR